MDKNEEVATSAFLFSVGLYITDIPRLNDKNGNNISLTIYTLAKAPNTFNGNKVVRINCVPKFIADEPFWRRNILTDCLIFTHRD